LILRVLKISAGDYELHPFRRITGKAVNTKKIPHTKLGTHTASTQTHTKQMEVENSQMAESGITPITEEPVPMALSLVRIVFVGIGLYLSSWLAWMILQIVLVGCRI
jgi:hypothetical protein